MSKIKINKDFSYPDPEDPEFLTKIFTKREFYYHRVPQRDKMETYEEIQKYRQANCKQGEIEPREQQAILPNYISPNTPYKGVILMHGVGSGKTMSAIRIAEQFKEQIKNYNTKIYVLVPGPNTRENFKKELLSSTGETYLKNKELLSQMSKQDIEREKKNAIFTALQYYKILSYKTFYKKVLGEKIIEKKLVGDTKIKSSYRKNLEGDYERELVIDRITNMNNSILIVDEAHNISGNEYGEALKKIIKNSENLRVILLTATPMINLADEIVDLLNYIRPLNDQVQRDKIFTGEKNYLMKIKPGGLEYLKDKAQGYISFYRGSIPYTFAKKVEKGKIPNDMLFTPVIKCFMENFQYNTYLETTKNIDDTLDKASSAISNFVFPLLNKEKNDIIGGYSAEGMINCISQIETDGPILRALVNKKIFNGSLTKEEENNFILESGKKNITGLILSLKYVKYFSIKFYKLLNRLGKLIEGYKGASTAFIYSNLVKAGGMELFAETLIQNGYLEYHENSINYDITDDTIDYKTGLTFYEFKKKNLTNFKPATFIIITGGVSESGEDIPEIKQKIIENVFNSIDNIDGKYIKFILGSKVMNEGVTLKNTKEVHILDVFYNIPKTEQVIGRAIRMCVHQNSITEKNRFPKVYIYRYVVAISNKNPLELSTDEILYQKAELKYLTVKEIERALKEIAFDCPLLLHANMFPEELEKYKDCVSPTLENIKAGKQICPALCDFRKCSLKCDSTKLNEKYWDNKTYYKKLDKSELDYNTFNDELAIYEITLIKNRIKDLYRFKHVYLYDEILKEIKNSFLQHQESLFEDYFLDQALQDMMPTTDNEFNNFKDTIYDKYNRPGYIIQRDKYYIFQPFNENEDVTMYYREHINFPKTNQVSLNNYITQKYGDIKEDTNIKETISKKHSIYDFESTLEYYDNREENFIVGIIDNNLNNLSSNNIDLFKIRPPLLKDVDKKRGTGISTFNGAVCYTSKDNKYLMELVTQLNDMVININLQIIKDHIKNIIKKISDDELDKIIKIISTDISNKHLISDITKYLKKIKTITNNEVEKSAEIIKLILIQDEISRIKKLTRENKCNEIKNMLLYLEKYSKSEYKNKKTYIRIPSNHSELVFPYNLEDRIKYKIKQVNKIITNVHITVNKLTDGTFLGKINKINYKYQLTFPNDKKINDDIAKKLNKLDFTLVDDLWKTILD